LTGCAFRNNISIINNLGRDSQAYDEGSIPFTRSNDFRHFFPTARLFCSHPFSERNEDGELDRFARQSKDWAKRDDVFA